VHSTHIPHKRKSFNIAFSGRYQVVVDEGSLFSVPGRSKKLSNGKEVDVLAREINKDWWNKTKDKSELLLFKYFCTFVF
jgi:hypothetical protein